MDADCWESTQASPFSPETFSIVFPWGVTMSDFGRTPRIGIVTTGCTGISRLRRRIAPAALEMTKEKRIHKNVTASQHDRC
jgi:hypothetical protein